MNRTRIALHKLLFSGLLIGTLFLLLVPAGKASAETLALQCGKWSIVNSPSPGSMDVLYGITAISPQDVWAVGRTIDKQGLNHVLIEHWNGTQWSHVASPDPFSTANYLLGIAAVSANDVWAVGGTDSGTLIEHWNGKQWSIVKNPGTGVLDGISVFSSTDIWAVGANGKTVVEHWDGKQWSIVKSPNPGKYGDQLWAVTTISATDVWAVGDAATTQFGTVSLIEHWNGMQWQVVKSPSTGRFPYGLRGISAVSASDIWAVGSYDTTPGDITLTLTEHWNGTKWSIVPSPSPTGNDYLLGVVALASNNVWAVGDRSSNDQNLVVHWDGTSWSEVPAAYRRGTISSLDSISADSANDMWAAGFDINTQNFTYQTLIEHYC